MQIMKDINETIQYVQDHRVHGMFQVPLKNYRVFFFFTVYNL